MACPMKVYFDLGTLSDRVLNLLLRGSGEGDRPKSQLVRAIADEMTRELLMRQSSSAWPARKSFEIDCGLDPSDTPAIADAIHNLILDITELERAAALSPAGSLEREELSAAACFLSCVGRAVAYLPGAAIAS